MSDNIVYVFHPDQDVCDDTSCPCSLPTQAQQDARDRAQSYNEWHVMYRSEGGADAGISPTLSEEDARKFLANLLRPTHARKYRAKLLCVIEDYDA
jgi:hypothetical protein